MTAAQALAFAGGVRGLPEVAGADARADVSIARDAAIAGMAARGAPLPGMSNLGGVGFGVIGILNAPPPPVAAFDRVIATAPAGATKEQVETRIQQLMQPRFETRFRAQGYEPRPVPRAEHQTMLVRSGCPSHRRFVFDPSCSVNYGVIATRQGTHDGKSVWLVQTGVSPSLETWSLRPEQSGYDFVRSVVDRSGGLLHLYVAPKRTDGGWTRPFLYTGGRSHAL